MFNSTEMKLYIFVHIFLYNEEYRPKFKINNK